MGILNPVYAVFIPFIFGITIPLAIVAGITSTFAFSVLICRVIVVYLDLIISIVSRSLFGLSLDKYRYSRRASNLSSSAASSSASYYYSHYSYLRRSPPSSSFSPSPSPSSPPSSYFQLSGLASGGSVSGTGKQAPVSPAAAGSPGHLRRHHRSNHRRGSIGGTATPVSETGLGLIPSVGPERDFEGIGGWRSGGDDDEIWTGINSRLELPDTKQQQQQLSRAGAPGVGAGAGASSSAGDNGVLMMKSRARSREKRRHMSASPNSSRIRAPSGSRFGNHHAGQASTSNCAGPGPVAAAGASGNTTANRGTKRVPPGK